MKKDEFISTFLPLARKAGEAFRLNPAVILAQAAIESGWGQSTLSAEYNNFFGITAYGPKNVWWTGPCIELGNYSLSFRVYHDPEASFMDYARLIRKAYPKAAQASFAPAAFAREIACSKYISEVNGDNREAYRRLLVGLARQIAKKICIDSNSLQTIKS